MMSKANRVTNTYSNIEGSAGDVIRSTDKHQQIDRKAIVWSKNEQYLRLRVKGMRLQGPQRSVFSPVGIIHDCSIASISGLCPSQFYKECNIVG